MTKQAILGLITKHIRGYAKDIGSNFKCDKQEIVTDILADLMHFCDKNKLDFENALEMAGFHHGQESASCPTHGYNWNPSECRDCREAQDKH